MNNVFVYGILRNGSTPAKLKGYEKFYRGHATIKKNENETVEGELRTVSDDELERFDWIEGVANGYYHRFKTIVEVGEGEKVEAWAYQMVEDYKNE